MMKFVTGFFMAWGNFLSLPCPYKKWDSNLKNMMLAFLPGVGMVVGLLGIALYWLLEYVNIQVSISGLIMMFYAYAICGFMHLDGFMDCNDAIMSRRPLEERQRILKDSHTGAFAVITLVFLFGILCIDIYGFWQTRYYEFVYDTSYKQRLFRVLCIDIQTYGT